MLNPIGDIVFVKKTVGEAPGLIIVPAEHEPQGTIVAVGAGKTYSDGNVYPLAISVGDKVIYSKHAGQTFTVDGEELVALHEDDIYAVID